MCWIHKHWGQIWTSQHNHVHSDLKESKPKKNWSSLKLAAFFRELPHSILPFLLILISKSNKNGKIGRLSVIPVGTTSIVIVGHFFGDPKGLNKFRWSRTKIRGTLYWELGVPNHPRNRWKWAKNDKNGSKSKFPHSPIFKFFVVIREVIPEKMAPISDSINFFWVLSLLSHCASIPYFSRFSAPQCWFTIVKTVILPENRCHRVPHSDLKA